MRVADKAGAIMIRLFRMNKNFDIEDSLEGLKLNNGGCVAEVQDVCRKQYLRGKSGSSFIAMSKAARSGAGRLSKFSMFSEMIANSSLEVMLQRCGREIVMARCGCQTGR